MYNYEIFNEWASAMAHEVSCSPPNAGVQSSRLGYSMWVFWWMNWSLGRCFSFFRVTNCIPPFLHTHLIQFVSFHFINPCECDRRGRSTSLLFSDLKYRYLALYRTWAEEIIRFN